MLPLVSTRDPETHRHAFRAEVRDLLQLLVLVHDEVVLLESRHEPPVGV